MRLIPFGWEFPYPSRRKPVLVANAVATSQPLAAQAGLAMLAQGGNAVDAAIACAIALTVVEPVSNGIGSDAFALVWDGERLHGLNASGRSPRAWSPERFASRGTMPERGWDSVTVPGAVSAWVELSKRFGKLPFERLFEPAIRYARDGFLVSPTIAGQWQKQVPLLKDQPGFAQAYLPCGRAPQPGERFRFPDQAHTLTRIAETEGEAFYRGEIAQRLVAHSQAHGGALTLEDLAAHQPDWVEPLGLSYRGYVLHELPPNGQGITALIALGILQHWQMTRYPADSADSVHLQIEAMKLAFADVHRFVADPSAMEPAPCQLLNEAYLARRSRLIDLERAQAFAPGTPPQGGTVYLAAADSDGMMMSYIQSNYQGFGSGVVVPGTGVSLQNRGAGFSLEPGHPNRVAGGKRPFHTIIPGFVTRNGQPVMSLGVMGAAMQPQGHLQVMVRLVDYRQNPQAAVDAPRFRWVQGRRIAFEPGFDRGVLEELSRRGHQIVPVDDDNQFGCAQLIYRLEDGYLAASDPRRDGQAVGF